MLQSKEITEKDMLEIGNSYTRLIDFPVEVLKDIDQVLTYYNDISHEKNALFQKIHYFKKFVDHDVKSIASKARQGLGFAKKQLKELMATEVVKWLDGDKFPTGHLNIVMDVLTEIYPKYQIVDKRTVPEKRWIFRLSKPFHEPRYYQNEMHELGLLHHRGVFESAVGTGKSLVLMRLIFTLGVTSLIVVPSKPLLDQLHADLIAHFGERNVEVVSSTSIDSDAKLRKMRKKPIRLINIQSLAAIHKKGNASKVLEGVDAIFIDEIHHSGSKSYTSLLEEMNHIYYRFGFTGTFLRNDSKTLDMWGFLSTKLYSYKASQAIAEGFLTPVKVIVHNLEGISKRKYQSEYDANYCGSEALLNKIQEIVSGIGSAEQVLILVNRKDKSGQVIHDFLNGFGIDNTYISGDSDKEEVRAALLDFNNKRVQILIGSQVIGEGIDLRSTEHLIMAQGGKSEIAIVQAAGRLIRLYKSKNIGYLHDFRFSNTNFMEKHLDQRIDIYKRNLEPKFQLAG